ncbi:MAG: hypothetical protein ACYTE3_25110 [Planctomycetota bacterium]|jgi:hypothetical protein
MRRIYENAGEKFVIQTVEGAKGGEVRVLINKNPLLKPRTSASSDTDSSTTGNQPNP